MLEVHDDLCITRWFDEVDLAKYTLTETRGNTVYYIHREEVKPVYSYSFLPNACILLNTGLFHDFDNPLNAKIRRVLTLRFANTGNIDFDSVAKLLKDN
jgi:hypothetical protein